MPTPPPKDRVRATKLRGYVKAGKTMTPEDAAWLEDYEQQRDVAKGASRSRTVKYEESEAQAVGTGSAAEVAAAAALSREEGRRFDHLLEGAMESMKAANVFMATACGMYQTMCAALLSRAQEDGAVVRDLLVAFRGSMLQNAELEADAIRAAAVADAAEGGDEMDKLAAQLLPSLLGQLQKRRGGTQKPPPVKPDVVPPGAQR